MEKRLKTFIIYLSLLFSVTVFSQKKAENIYSLNTHIKKSHAYSNESIGGNSFSIRNNLLITEKLNLVTPRPLRKEYNINSHFVVKGLARISYRL